MADSVKILVVGTGYVGLVTGACLADIGHKVICVDKDQDKIDLLEKGIMPIYEPGLKEVVDRNVSASRLSFSNELLLDGIETVFLAVGTPTDEETGNANMEIFFAAAKDVQEKKNSSITIVSKSTVPVGTGSKLKGIFSDSDSIVSNPEFLREGTAVADFMNPDRVVVGCEGDTAKTLMDKIYKPLNAEIFYTSIATSELIKYASNSFLATKVVFINEMADLCEATGANVEELADGMGLDNRIGRSFLNAGPGIGGSCFPKDIKALKAQSNDAGVKSLIIDGVIASNENRKKTLAQRIAKYVGRGKVALFGLAFKANTDDVRESAAIDIAVNLVDLGIEVSAYDPKADIDDVDNRIEICDTAKNAAENADAIVILTEWSEFCDIDYSSLNVKNKVIFDLRNILSNKIPRDFTYFSVGRNMPI